MYLARCGPKPKEDMIIVGFNNELRYSCTIEPQRNVNRCTVQENKSGKVRCQRDFRVQPGDHYAAEGDFGQLVSFDGENIRMRTGSGREVILSPLMPCKVED